jgi:hypothetical protein
VRGHNQLSSRLARRLALPAIGVAMLTAGLAGAVPSLAAATHTGRPAAVATGTNLWAVSCPRSAWCMAAGTTPGKSGAQHALAEIWNGKDWRVLTNAPGQSIRSVSCSAPWFCMTRGTAGTWTWNGTGWRKITGPSKPAGPISCGGRRLCAVLSNDGSLYGTVVQIWNGSTWRDWPRQTSACYGGAPGQCGMYAVSCGNAVNCMAVGTFTEDNEGDQGALSVDWNGKGWKGTGGMPWNGDPVYAYTDSCASYFCLATGGAYQESPADGDIAGGATWTKAHSGSGWHNASPSLGTICSGYATCGWDNQISCGSPTNCMTFSGYGDLDWNGSTWNNDPAVSEGAESSLTALSCQGPACMAVGFRTVGGVRKSLVELFNGTSWSVVSAPD